MVAWRYKISLLVLKKIFHSFTAHTYEIFFQHSKINFVSLFGRVKSSISYLIGQYLILCELKYPQIKILVKFKHR